MIRRERKARLTVLVGEAQQAHHRPLSTEVLHRAHRAGMAGASVFRGLEGYGRSNHIHTSRLLSLSDDLPVAVVVVDSPERIERFLAELEGLPELRTSGLVLVEPVEVVRYDDAGGPERHP